MKVRTREEAWKEVDKIFPTDYYKDEQSSQRAGYPILRSTADNVNAWISDLNCRLEVNIQNPDTKNIESTNIWIEDEPKLSVTEFLMRYIADSAIICLCEENGNINYTGPAKDAPFWAFVPRDFIRVDGIGCEGDLMIVTGPRKIKSHR